MLNKIKDYFKNLSVDPMEQAYEKIKKNPSTLDKAIAENKVEEFVECVELTHTKKQQNAEKQAQINSILETDDYIAPKQQVRTKSMNNMYTREFVRHNVDGELAKMMTLMSKPARDYKIKKTIARTLFK